MEINYKKKYEFQKNITSRQQKQIEDLKSQIAKLEVECKEKDKIIHSVDSLRTELAENIKDVKAKKAEFESLVKELKEMKSDMNEIVFKNRWKLIRLLMK